MMVGFPSVSLPTSLTICPSLPPATAFFGFPFDIEAMGTADENQSLSQAPVVYLQINSIGSWERRRIEVRLAGCGVSIG